MLYFILFIYENSRTSAYNQKTDIQILHIKLQLVKYFLSLIGMFGIRNVCNLLCALVCIKYY